MVDKKNYEALVDLFDKQLEFAQNLQKKIIPKQEYFKSDYYYFHSILKPFRKVGGDFFDFTFIENDCVNLIISDATGHGIDAAMITSMVKLIYIYSMRDPILSISPSLFIKQLELDVSQLINNIFFTGINLLLDPKNNCLYYSNAGHPSGILLKSTGKIQLLHPNLPMIGLQQLTSNLTYNDIKLDFSYGDKLFLMTDGLIDERNYDNEEFSLERVVSIISKEKHLAVSRICDHIIMEYQNFKKTKAPSDDVCILGIEYDFKN
ncbi:MAG: PP2C family protein-serine/threonine phosphatase [Eubacteriaceae bacterium]